jgi:hypothetical protein
MMNDLKVCHYLLTRHMALTLYEAEVTYIISQNWLIMLPNIKYRCRYYIPLGRAMVPAVSRRLLNAEARVRSRVSPYGIYGGQSGIGTVFSSICLVFLGPCHSYVVRYSCIICGIKNRPDGSRMSEI